MKESSEEPNVASIRSKSNYFQYYKKGLPKVSTVRNNDFFSFSNGFIHFEFSQRFDNTHACLYLEKIFCFAAPW